jgi:hypothetical protein
MIIGVRTADRVSPVLQKSEICDQVSPVLQSEGQGTAKDILGVLDRFFKPLSDQLEKYQILGI